VSYTINNSINGSINLKYRLAIVPLLSSLSSLSNVFPRLSTKALLFWHLSKVRPRDRKGGDSDFSMRGWVYESSDRRGNKGNALGTFAHFIFLIDLTEVDPFRSRGLPPLSALP